jgi:hypothetical protein
MSEWSDVATLIRYWMKGRFTRATAIWMGIGEVFAIVVVLLVGGTFVSFSSRFGVGGGLSYIGLNLLFAFFLIGLIQSGFNGSGLPVGSADVDYVFTSPVKPRAVFAAKVFMNSFTTVLLAFPPIVALYLKLAAPYGTPFFDSILAGLVTLVFFVLALFFAADITLSLNSTVGSNLKALRNGLLVAVAALGLAPITLLIPGAPAAIGQLSEVLPSGLTAQVSYGLVSGAPWTLDRLLYLLLLGAWFAALLGLGIRMAKNNFYEVLQIMDRDSDSALKDATVGRGLDTEGTPVWNVVRRKERVLMSRTKEMRSLIINALFLAGFMVIYSLSGIFLSSPTSFLFLLFIIGSFGSGNATRWLEKERLWLIKTSPLDLKKYVAQVYRARVTPLLLVLSPVAAGVGAPLLFERLSDPGALLAIGLSLPAALEIAALMMAGGMYFAARYGQSSVDDTLTSQGQDLADIRRFLYQTIINLSLVAPLMGLVFGASDIPALLGDSSLPVVGAGLGSLALVYTVLILRYVLSQAGTSLQRREDL